MPAALNRARLCAFVGALVLTGGVLAVRARLSPAPAAHDLVEALEEDDAAALAALLDRQGNVNARGTSGQTLLLMAEARGRVSMVQLLAAHGADLEARDIAGQTA